MGDVFLGERNVVPHTIASWCAAHHLEALQPALEELGDSVHDLSLLTQEDIAHMQLKPLTARRLTATLKSSTLAPEGALLTSGDLTPAELDSADDLLDDDDQFETKKTEGHSMGIRLGLADDEDENRRRRRRRKSEENTDDEDENRRRRRKSEENTAQSSLKDTVSVQVSNFICTAKGPQCEGKTCDLDKWTKVNDRKICIKGDEEARYCLLFEKDDSDYEFKVRVGGMKYNYKATQERKGSTSQGGNKTTTEMKPNGVLAVIATTAAPEETEDGVQSEGGGQCFFTMQHRKIGIPLAKEPDEDAEDADADADAD